MSGDYKPLAEKAEAEVSAFLKLWRKKRWLAIAIIMVAVGWGVFPLVGWFNQKERVSQLDKQVQDLKIDLRAERSENRSLRETVAPLIKQAAKEFPGEEINRSLKKVIAGLEAARPANQAIQSATASVEVRTTANRGPGDHLLTGNNYLAFGKGTESLLQVSTRDHFVKRMANGELAYTAAMTMGASEKAVGQRMVMLTNSEFIQISFESMPQGTRITGGKAIVTINSTAFEFEVPPLATGDKKFFNIPIAAEMRLKLAE